MTRRVTTGRGEAAAWQDPTGDGGRRERTPWPVVVVWLLAAASALGAAFAGGIAWEARRELRAFKAEEEWAWRDLAIVLSRQNETMQNELYKGENGNED